MNQEPTLAKLLEAWQDGALSEADGTGSCRVFEGKADVSLLDSIGEVKQTRRLLANESMRVNPSKQDMRVINEENDDYPDIKQPPRPTLALPHFYDSEVMGMGPVGYWRFEEIRNREVVDEVTGGARLQATGSVSIATESGGNHSGELMWREEMEFFQISNGSAPMMAGDFSISLFAQFEWLQNFALLSATRYGAEVEGNSFILQPTRRSAGRVSTALDCTRCCAIRRHGMAASRFLATRCCAPATGTTSPPSERVACSPSTSTESP